MIQVICQYYVVTNMYYCDSCHKNSCNNSWFIPKSHSLYIDTICPFGHFSDNSLNTIHKQLKSVIDTTDQLMSYDTKNLCHRILWNSLRKKLEKVMLNETLDLCSTFEVLFCKRKWKNFLFVNCEKHDTCSDGKITLRSSNYVRKMLLEGCWSVCGL
jgi:hypothetical protein